MSVAEIKKVILEKMNDLTEEQLFDLKQFIERINNPKGKEYDLIGHIKNIVSEREEVLKKN